jgi:hypothetical protein
MLQSRFEYVDPELLGPRVSAPACVCDVGKTQNISTSAATGAEIKTAAIFF